MLTLALLKSAALPDSDRNLDPGISGMPGCTAPVIDSHKDVGGTVGYGGKVDETGGACGVGETVQIGVCRKHHLIYATAH
jgi:hypothetical protein